MILYLAGLLVFMLTTSSHSRELSIGSSQFYQEVLFEAGLGLLIEYTNFKYNHESKGRAGFPTQHLDDQVSTWLNGRHHTPYYTEAEHRYHLISDRIQDIVRYSTLISPLAKPEGHKLGALFTIIHANNIWHFFTYTLKYTVQRKRPKYYYTQNPSAANTHSFPSGHTGRTFVMAFIADRIFELPTWVRVSLYSLASSVGVMRITSNRHFFTDVVGAIGIAYFSANLSYILFEPNDEEQVGSQAINLSFGPGYLSLTYDF